MAEKVEEKVQKYWFESCVVNDKNMKVNHLIYIACVFDPRSKLDLVSEVLEMMYGNVKGGEMVDCTRSEMRQLFEVYKGMYGSKAPSSASEPTTGESTAGGDMIKQLMERLSKRKREALLQDTGGSFAELDIYLRCQTDGINEENDDAKFDILSWWSRHSGTYPILAEMAKDILDVPISSVASEATFSCGSRILSPFRSTLSDIMLEALICAEDWIKYQTTGAGENDEREDDEEIMDLESVNTTFQSRMESASDVGNVANVDASLNIPDGNEQEGEENVPEEAYEKDGYDDVFHDLLPKLKEKGYVDVGSSSIDK
ncbi:unnamed protein product [Linum trigynum]|uniref:Transposase n=1 Tax=Linum trigynum TaxID=586398 RepID=A0AAV2ES71_9ROSI